MFEDAKENEDGILEIGPESLARADSTVKIVDVRRDEEFVGELGHIEGVELITLETDFESRLKTFDKDQTYVFVCRSGLRSSKAASLARAMGVKKVYNLAGGMMAWNQKGLPTK